MFIMAHTFNVMTLLLLAHVEQQQTGLKKQPRKTKDWFN